MFKRWRLLMNKVNLKVAENLKSIRISKGWSQSFVARQLGIAQRTISRAECACGVSKRTLKMLCSLYQVSVTSLYKEDSEELPKRVPIVPEDVVVELLMKHSFTQELEQEVLIRYHDMIQREVLMRREEVEQIISEIFPYKKIYSFMDIITIGMLVNQKTLESIRKLLIVK